MRKKIAEDKKKKKTAVSIDERLMEIMDEYLTDNDIKRSRYIEKLIREDMERRGKNVENNF